MLPHADGPEAHPRLAGLFEAFERERVVWCLLRGEAELDQPSGDVDILVARADVERLRGIAGRLGFARLPAPGHATHLFLITYDQLSDTWLKLDVVTELAFGPSFAYRLPSVVTGSCLDRRGRVGPAFGLDPRDGFWAGLLHGLLDKPRIEDAELARARGLAGAARDGGPLARVVATLLPAGWSTDRVIDAVERGDRDDLVAFATGLARSWRRRSPIGTTARRIDAGVRRRAGRAARIRRPRGLDVVLVGDVDLARRLAADLATAVPLPVRVAGGSTSSSLAGRIRGSLHVASGLVLHAVAGTSATIAASTSTRPDLVIVLDPTRAPTTGPNAPNGPPVERSAIRTVDASGPEDRLRREVASLVWARLADRWNAIDGGGRG